MRSSHRSRRSDRPVARVLLAALVLLAHFVARPARAASQDDVVAIGAQAVAAAPLDDRHGDRHGYGVAALLAPPALVLGARDRLSLRFAYRGTRIELDGDARLGDEPLRRDLHAVDVGLAWSHVLGRSLVLTLGASPGLRSDLRSRFVLAEDAQLAGFGLLTWLVGGDPRLRLSFGVLAQTHAALTPVLPFVTLDWRTETFALSAGAAGLTALLRAGDRAEVGTFASFGGDWYRIAPSAGPRIGAARNLRLVDVGVGAQLDVRLFGPVWLGGRAGYRVVQLGKLGDADRSTLPGISLDTAGTFFGEAGVSVRLPAR